MSSPQVTPEVISPARIREKAPVTTSEKPRGTQPKITPKPQAKPTAPSVAKKPTSPQNGKEETRKPLPTSSSSHPERTTAAEALIAEGVTPARARDFASLFEPERIARNITLGLHRTKTNPPRLRLLRLIQDDAASKQVSPDSEADRVRSRERLLAVQLWPNWPHGGRRSARTRRPECFFSLTQAPSARL